MVFSKRARWVALWSLAVSLGLPALAPEARGQEALPFAATPQSIEERLRAIEAKENEQPVAPPASAPIANLAEGGTHGTDKSHLTLGGYAEVYYQHGFGNPDNRLTNFRGFDNRSGMFTIQNAVLDAVGALGPVTTHVALQFGHAPESYYLSEPHSAGSAAVGGSGPQPWKYLQQANMTWIVPVGRGLTTDAGLFLSPIGPEGIAVKDQWNWSRSNLFFGLPFYHTGARATYPLGEHGSVSLQLYNGWNSVVDNNRPLSVAGQYTYNRPDHLTVNVLYFGGVERPAGAPEGQPWRHLVDAYVAAYPTERLSLLAQVDAGTEATAMGRSGWAAAAAYVRIKAQARLYLAARADFFREWIAQGAAASAAPLFWGGARWVRSLTLTADLRPAENLSVRAECRRDDAERPLYFRDHVTTDSQGDFLANSATQVTCTLGAVSWF